MRFFSTDHPQRHFQFVFRVACVLVMLLAACVPLIVVPASPACRPLFLTTGEALLPATMHVPPPVQVAAGEQLQVSFSSGYFLLPTGYQCGEKTLVLTPNIATAKVRERPVQVFLDERLIHEVICPFDCELTIVVPEDALPGIYSILISSTMMREEFTVEIE